MISLDGKNLPQHVDCDTSKLEVQRKRRKEIEINGQKAEMEFGKLLFRRQEISKIGRNNKEVKEGRKKESQKEKRKERKKKRRKEKKKKRMRKTGKE